MFSLNKLTYVAAAAFWLLPLVTSIPLEKRLNSGFAETGGSATIQYTDPATNIQWVKNYHVRVDDGAIMEAYAQNSGDWSEYALSSAYTADRDGGLAAFAFVNDNTGTPEIHLYYDDLATGYLKSLVWTQSGGWTADTSYNSAASEWVSTARSSAAITFNNGVRHFNVFITTSDYTINQITWTLETGWVAGAQQLVATINSSNGINRDVAVVSWASGNEISLFYAEQQGVTGYWNIYELHYSSSTNSWSTWGHGSNFNNFEGVFGIGLAAIAWETSAGLSVRLYAQGDSYVELGTDNGGAWYSSVLGSCTSEAIVRQGQISAVHWMPDTVHNSIRYVQVQCTSTACNYPLLRVKSYDSANAFQWYNLVTIGEDS